MLNAKQCRRTKKRRYNSREAALRAGTQRYGTTSNAYVCRHCGKWHLTRQGTPEQEDPQLEQLARALLGKAAS